MPNPFDQFDAAQTDSAPPSNVFDQFDDHQAIPKKDDSFLAEMGQNTAHGIQSGRDLLSGNFSFPGYNNPTGSRTQALADRLFPEGSEGATSGIGALMAALPNVGGAVSSGDISGALLEKFGDTPAGKGLSVIGAHPVFNAIGTTVNRYVNPFIEKHTGIAPENLQLLELGASGVGGGVGLVKGKTGFSDPIVSTVKSASNKVTETLNKPKDVPLTSSNVADLAHRSYAAADDLGGALNPDAVNKFIKSASDIAPQTEEGRAFSGNNPVTQTIADFKSIEDKPLSLKAMQEIDEDLSNRIDDQTDPIKGVNKVGYKLQEIQQKFRNSFLDAPDSDLTGGAEGIKAWREGQQLWATKIRMGDVERILNKAESADVPSTAIKNGLKTYTNKASNKRGWNDDEWAMLQKGAKTGIGTGILKTLGSKLISGVAGAVGGSGGGFPGAMLGAAAGEAIAYPLRLSASALQKRPATAALKSLSDRPVINDVTQPTSRPMLPAPMASKQAPRAIDNFLTQRLPSATLRSAPDLSSPPPAAPKAQALPISGSQSKVTIGGDEGNDNLDQQSSIESIIHDAANNVGVDPDLQHAMASVESGLDPNAKASTSSASGLNQITKPTWQSLVMKYGKQYGFGMNDIMNPEANSTAAALLTKDNTEKLSNKLGREPDAAEIYTAHFMGANKAVKLINAEPRDIAAKLFPAEAYANKNIFYYKDGKPRDVYAVRQLLGDKINKAIGKQQDARAQAQQEATNKAAQQQKDTVLQAMLSKIPQESVQALRGNPQLAGDFNQMYGDGASALFTS